MTRQEKQGDGNSAASRDIAHHLHPYTNLKTHLEKGPHIIAGGKGVRVFDDAGKSYIEGLSGLWCAALGFSEERLVEAATKAMRRLPFYHSFGGKASQPVIDLAEKLIELAPVPMSKVFFANSGSEANDTAIKIVRYVNNAWGRPEKKKIIARNKAYHGVTVASASLTGLAPNHRDFDLPMDGVLHTACPHHYRFALPKETEREFADRCALDLETMILDEGPETVAAFFAEPVMGAGGVIVPPAGYFEKIQAVLKKYDVLFVADEVICGFGRTGNFWGSQTFGLKPDMMTCAKALSAAYLPISALMVSEPIFQAMARESEKIGIFGHGFTYGGHPVSASVALEALKIYEERDIVGHVRDVGPALQGGLRALGEHPLIGEARGVGLIGGLDLVKDKAEKTSFDPAEGVAAYLWGRIEKNGVITRVMGDTVAFAPPLIIDREEIEEMLDAVSRALDETADWAAARGFI